MLADKKPAKEYRRKVGRLAPLTGRSARATVAGLTGKSARATVIGLTGKSARATVHVKERINTPAV